MGDPALWEQESIQEAAAPASGCRLPINREHLLMAGRCISGTSRAHASFRVTGDCVATGQAAGTAAAFSVQRGIPPSELDPAELVHRLRRDDVQI